VKGNDPDEWLRSATTARPILKTRRDNVGQ
jgi:hypothetical protein